MQEFDAEKVRFETVSALGSISRAKTIDPYPAYIELGVYEETIET